MKAVDSTNIDKFIDIEKVVSGKNPKLATKIPGFIYRYLKRILHEDEINVIIKKSDSLYGLDFVSAIIKDFNPVITTRGIENIPTDKRVIVASNHPLGGLDGIALMHVTGSIRSDILFPVNDILLYIDNLKPLFIPINKHGSNSENLKILNDTFEGNNLICYFPFGLCSRKKNGRIIDLDWKKTFISKSKQYQRDIIPTHIEGRNTNFFYNLSNIRKKLGIKANIEMLYLVDEFFHQYNKPLIITFGPSISWQTFDKRHTDAEWAMLLRNYSYQLKDNPDLIFDPNYNYTIG